MIRLHDHSDRVRKLFSLFAFQSVLAGLLCSSAFSQISHDATSSALGSSSTLTWPHTTGTGDDRLLIVGVSNRRSNRTVSGVTYAGRSLTRAGFRNSVLSTSRLEIWYLLAPPPGSADVIVTLSASTDLVCGAISFSGVDQTTPLGPFTSAIGLGVSASLSLASAANEIVVDVVTAPGFAGSLTPGVGQTTNWNMGTGTGGSNVHGGSSNRAGASSVTMSWALGGLSDWAIGAVTLKPTLNPNMVLTLVQNENNPSPGGNVVYTINYVNTGGGSAVNVRFAISPPANTAFLPDGVVLNGTPKTDAPDADEVTLSGPTITVTLGTVPAGATGTLSYQVVIQ
ncbi:MAG: hypothetical protein H6Q30_1095 [Bacteroidetes bacterium]|jgi:uncharacterized repeat protein (TIGR01451 family)|nr:hypothetical protein [Bacteroidota bacterium]